MKRATKHYLKFKADELLEGHQKATINLSISLLEEVPEQIKKRNSNTDETVTSILKSINRKWKAICLKEKSLNPEGFSKLLKNRKGITI